jgi:8-oxo-dGTP pyrophosphatase MutT (NUDIX family)
MKEPASGLVRWTRGEERPLVKTRVLEVWSRRYARPGRSDEREFVVAKAPDWVNVLAVTPDGRLVLVKQFRHGIDGFSLEIPGGVVEPGEDPVAAGVRELREETGFAGPGAQLLASVHPNPAVQNNRCHVVLVKGAVPSGPTDWDPDEEIEVSTMAVGEVFDAARAGRISHSLTIASLFQFEPVWVALTGAIGRSIQGEPQAQGLARTGGPPVPT